MKLIETHCDQNAYLVNIKDFCNNCKKVVHFSVYLFLPFDMLKYGEKFYKEYHILTLPLRNFKCGNVAYILSVRFVFRKLLKSNLLPHESTEN
jgi:hypothetical protein